MDKLNIYFLLQLAFYIGDALNVNRTTFRRRARITDGEETTIEEFPYQAYLTLYDGRTETQCGGSIISVNVVLTAAHCLVGIELVTILTGATFTDGSGRRYESDSFQKHPLFKERNEDFDIGLVRVERGMVLDGVRARAIELVPMGHDPQPGTHVIITGWGLTHENDTEYPTQLHDAGTHVVERARCNEMLGGGITMRMFCAGETTREPDVCLGDYGGPAVEEGNGRQIGIASYGDGCGELNSPSVYTRIGSLPIRMFIMAMAGV